MSRSNLQCLQQKLPPTISSTLSGLSKRPNVHSTLILSREDGSIISVTGQLASPQTSPQNTETEPTTKATPTAAEELALSIFSFVSSAKSLGMTMEPLLAQKNTSLRSLTTYEPTTSKPEDGEVQLLRLRTKKHEIIVYPDTRFLCCVVSRSGHGQGQGIGDNTGT